MIQAQRATYVIEVKRKREIGHEVIKEMERRVAKIPLAGKTQTRRCRFS